MKKAFFATKYYKNNYNKKKIENITEALEKANLKIISMVNDKMFCGKNKPTSEKLMKETFKKINKCDIFVADLSEKSIGVGVEIGYAFALKKPVVVISNKKSNISSTIKGVAKQVICYKKPREVTKKILQGSYLF